MSLFLLLIIHSWCIHITFLASVTSVVHRNLIYFTVTSRLITELGDRKPKQQGYNWRHFHYFQVLKWQDDVKLYLWRKIFDKYFIKCLFRIPVDCNLIRYLINICSESRWAAISSAHRACSVAICEGAGKVFGWKVAELLLPIAIFSRVDYHHHHHHQHHHLRHHLPISIRWQFKHRAELLCGSEEVLFAEVW